jgi:hypothetical protein
MAGMALELAWKAAKAKAAMAAAAKAAEAKLPLLTTLPAKTHLFD